jgi:2OG-Fe(II) oxygenase superfamily
MLKLSTSVEVDLRVEIALEYDAKAFAVSIRKIMRGELVAAIFKNFAPPDVSDVACESLTAIGAEPYSGAEGVGRVGDSLYETGHSKQRWVDYYNKEKENLARSRSLFPDGQYPIDRLRIDLDDNWHRPVSRLRLEDGLCNLGLCRALATDGFIWPHNDVPRADVPGSLLAQQIDIAVTCNLYLSVPEWGGEVKVYPQRLSRNEYDANRRPAPNDYAVRDEILVPDPVIIRPEKGDLIIWDADYLHSVGACKGQTPRYTLSSFIGVTRDQELRLYS